MTGEWEQCSAGALGSGAEELKHLQHAKHPKKLGSGRDVLTLNSEGPAAGHPASAVGSCAAVLPAVSGPGSQQAEAVGSLVLINLNGAFSCPHRDAFQEPGYLRLRDP